MVMAKQVVYLEYFGEDGFGYPAPRLRTEKINLSKGAVGYVRSDIAIDLYEQNKLLNHALKLIHNRKYKTCKQFPLCDHSSCMSSYRAWAIVDEIFDVLRE